MGLELSLPEEAAGQQQVSSGRSSVSSDEVKFEVSSQMDDWLVVTSSNATGQEQRTLQFNPSTSYAVCSGVGYALNKILAKSDLKESAENDPRRFFSLLRYQLGLPADNVECLTSKSSAYAATMSNVFDLLTEASSKVGEDGMLFFSFSGHGRVRQNEDGSKSGVIIPADNFGSDTSCILTSRHFERCLEKCKAKYIVIFLDCCHAGLLASSLASDTVQAASEVFVLAACSKSEVSLCHSELGSGFFTFFMSDYIRRKGEAGRLPIGGALAHGQVLCPAMAKLCVHSELDMKSKAPGTGVVMHPLLRAKVKFDISAGSANISSGGRESYSDDQVDAGRPVYRSKGPLSVKYLAQFVSDRGRNPLDLVPDVVAIWLVETAMPSIQALYTHGYLVQSHEEYDDVMRCVVCLLARSVATVFVDYGDGQANDPDMFLAFFVYVYNAFTQAIEEAEGNKNVDESDKPKMLNYHAILALHHYVVGLTKAIGGNIEAMRGHMELIVDMKAGLVEDDGGGNSDEYYRPRGHDPSENRDHDKHRATARQQAVSVAGCDFPDHPGAGPPNAMQDTQATMDEIMHRLKLDIRVPLTKAAQP